MAETQYDLTLEDALNLLAELDTLYDFAAFIEDDEVRPSDAMLCSMCMKAIRKEVQP